MVDWILTAEAKQFVSEGAAETEGIGEGLALGAAEGLEF